jgi:GcrA cell cycle regulator
MPEETSNWTDERIDLLKAKLLEGKSASQIAAELRGGATRNSVIGKIHRLKLQRPKTKQVRTYQEKKPKRSRAFVLDDHRQRSTLLHRRGALPPFPSKVFTGPEEPAYLPRVALVDLDRHGCHWPMGDPLLAGFGFCGCPARGGSSYCDEHHRRAYK